MVSRKSPMLAVFSVAAALLLGGCSLFPNLPTAKSSSSKTPDAGTKPAITTGKVIAESTVTAAPGGGTINVNSPGDPLNGMQIVIPAGAYPANQRITISYANIEQQTFSPDLNPVTPLISLDNGGLYSDGLMKVRVPVTVPAGSFAMGFAYDAKGHTLEGLPTVARDAYSITVATRHLAPFLVSSIDGSKLKNDVDSHFTPGVNDWEIPNYGSYITPKGNCGGMSLSAMWFFLTKPEGPAATLNGLYDNNGIKPATPAFWWDDALAYRLVSVVQKEYADNWTTYLNQLEDETISGAAPINDEETWKMFVYSIQVTGEPQYIYLSSKSGSAHVMVVYRAAGGSLYVADPNYKGKTDRRINFAAGKLGPYNSALNQAELDASKNSVYESVWYGAKTAVVDWRLIARTWDELKDNTVGNDEFPSFTLKYTTPDGKTGPLTNGTVLPANRIRISAQSSDGALDTSACQGGYLMATDAGGLIQLAPGINTFGVLVEGKVDGVKKYLDYVNLKVTCNASVSPITSVVPSSSKPITTATTASARGWTLVNTTVNYLSAPPKPAFSTVYDHQITMTDKAWSLAIDPNPSTEVLFTLRFDSPPARLTPGQAIELTATPTLSSNFTLWNRQIEIVFGAYGQATTLPIPGDSNWIYNHSTVAVSFHGLTHPYTFTVYIAPTTTTQAGGTVKPQDDLYLFFNVNYAERDYLVAWHYQAV